MDAHIEKSATALTILYMMGEAEKLSVEESTEVIQTVTRHRDIHVNMGVLPPRLRP